MHPISHSMSKIIRFLSALLIMVSAGGLNTACNRSSAGSQQNLQASASPAPATGAQSDEVSKNAPATAISPASRVTLPPSVVPTSPVGPIGQATPTSQGERVEMRGNMPVTVSSAKPMLTPAPDPFPARPTPSVVMADGKIVQQWQAPTDAAKLTNPMKGKSDTVALGREFYMQKCADCHGKEGKGNGWMGQALKRNGKPLPPTNLASKMVQANSDGELFWKITNGRSPMPSHRVRFEDEQRWHIVSFLRSLKE